MAIFDDDEAKKLNVGDILVRDGVRYIKMIETGLFAQIIATAEEIDVFKQECNDYAVLNRKPTQH